jgi:proteasome beta subunit
MEEAKTLKGTTTVGLVCSDGIIFAADKRAIMGGYFISNRDVDKIHQIDDTLGVTIAGGVGDAQTLVRYLKFEAQLYKMNYAKPMSVGAATNLLANILSQYKFAPFLVQILVGGVDDKSRIFNLDAVGGVTEEKFVSTGSGSPVAYGLLEDAYKEEGSIKDNLKAALRALSVAMKRDAGTGDGIDLVTITPAEFKRFDKDAIKKILETKA